MWSAMTCGACAIAVALLVSYQVEAPAKLKAAPYIGTMYDGANIGGYVLIGLAMFVLGVAVTLLCTWHARHKR